MAFLRGNNKSNTIKGTGKRDWIFARDGDDDVDGGDGNDVIFSGRGNDTVDGGNGNDLIFSGRGDDTVDGGDGDDIISAGRGNDDVDGGDGNDHIYAGRGNDIIRGGAGNDKIMAGHGNDTVIHDALKNIDSHDYYHGGRGRDTLVLQITQTMHDDAVFQTEWAQFQDRINSGRAVSGKFSSLNVTFASFENIQIEIINSTPEISIAHPDAVIEGDSGLSDIVTVAIADYVTIIDQDIGDTPIHYAGGLVFVEASGPQSLGGLESLFALDTTTGTISFDRAHLDYLNDNETVTATFSFNASSGPDTLVQTIIVTITGGNDAPTVHRAIDDQNSDEDTPWEFIIDEETFNDVESAVLTLTATLADGNNLPDWLSFDGSKLTGTPPQDYNGEFNIKISAKDGGGKTVETTFTVTVDAINDAPIVHKGIADHNSDEDTFLSLVIPADIFMDVDSALSRPIATLADGSALPDWLTVEGNTIFGTPPTNFNGDLDIKLTVEDDHSETAEVIFKLTIAGVNDLPILEQIIDDQNSDEDTPLEFFVPAGTFSDVETAILALSAGLADGSDLPGWLSFDGAGFSGTPPPDFNGVIDIKVIAEDEDGGTVEAVFQVAINPVNDAPVVYQIIEGQNSDEDAEWQFTIHEDTFGDVDSTHLTLSATLADGSELPGWLTFTGNKFHGTPPGDFNGDIVIIVTAKDDHDATAQTGFTLTIKPVNDRPSAVDDAFSGDEDTQIFGNVLEDNGNGTDNDIDGDALSVVAETIEIEGAGIVDLKSDGSFVFKPVADFNGVASFDYTLTDGDMNSVGTVTINVTPVNDAPVVDQGIDDQNSDEDTEWTFIIPVDAFGDDDSTHLTLSATLADGKGLPYWLSFDGSKLTGTPPQDYNGEYNIKITAKDGGGKTVETTFTVTVDAVNDAPIVHKGIADQNSDEDTFLSLVIPADIFMDVDSALSRPIATLADGSALPDWLTFEGYTIFGTPPTNFNGDLDIKLAVEDDHGETAEVIFKLTIADVNDLPILEQIIDDQNSDEDTPWEFIVPAGTFSDVETANLALSAGLADGSDLPGWLTFDGAGFSGTPPPDFNDVIDIKVIAEDEDGGTVEAVFQVAINPVNDAPVVYQIIEGQNSDEDAEWQFTIHEDTFGDVDSTHLTLSATLADGSELPGWLTFTGNKFHGTPPGDFNGDIELIVTAKDDHDATAQTGFTLTIKPVNDGPSAVDDAFSGDEDMPVNGNVLVDNGNGADSDIDGDALSVVAETIEIEGAGIVDLKPDGSFVFAPVANFNGVTSFRYTLFDGVSKGGAIATITVAPVNDVPTAVDDAFSGDEDTQVTGNVLVDNGNGPDNDVDGDALSVVAEIFEIEGAGIVDLKSDGSFVFTPVADFNGVASFDYALTDKDMNSVGTVTINVTPVNDAPVVDQGIDDQNSDEDTVWNFTIPADAFGDVDSSNLTLTATLADGSELPSWLQLNGSTFLGTPPNNQNDIDIRVTATDGYGETAEATFTLAINEVNDAPVAADLDAGLLTNEDTPISFSMTPVIEASTDDGGPLDADNLTITGVTVDGTPYALRDFDISYANGTLVFDPTGIARFAGTSINPDLFGERPGAVALQSLAVGATATVAVTYEIADAEGLTDTGVVSFDVEGQNDAPVTVDIDAGTLTDEDTIAHYDMAAVLNASFDDGDQLTSGDVSLVGASVGGQPVDPAQFGITYDDATGLLRLDPTSINVFQALQEGSSETLTVVYELTDSEGLSNTGEVVFAIDGRNDAPVATNTTIGLAQDTTNTGNILTRFTDLEGDVLSVQVVSTVQNGTLSIDSDGTYAYTPTGGFLGSDSFTIEVSDSNGGVDTATITFRVLRSVDPNGAGDLIGSDDGDFIEGGGDYDQINPGLGDDIINSGDGKDTIVGSTDELSGDTIALDAGDVVIVEATTFSKSDLTASPGSLIVTGDFDGDGVEDQIRFENRTVDDFENLVVVNRAGATYLAFDQIGRNDAPILINDTINTTEDASITVNSLLDNDFDVEGSRVRITGIEAAANGDVVLHDDGSVTYTPDADFFGTDHFFYTATDGFASERARVTVFASSVNDDPVAFADALTIDEDENVEITSLLDNDRDVDGNILTIASVGPAANGTAELQVNGHVSYTPDKDFFGTDTFTYTVTDGEASHTATVTVTVNELNDEPVADFDFDETREDEAITIDYALLNDTDINGDTLTIVDVGLAENGIVILGADNTITYRPNPDFFGEDTFSYTISDGELFASSDIYIYVAPVEDAPTADDDTASTLENQAVVLSNLLDNDVDVDGDTLTITAVGTPANGSAVLGSDGAVTYTPDPGFSGSDTFTYTTSDGRLEDTASVTINVMPVNDAPVAEDIDAIISEDGILQLTTFPYVDVDGDTAVVISVGSAANGQAVLNSDGSITYTPDPDFFGQETFTYTLSDGELTDTAEVRVTVQSVNDAPEASDLDLGILTAEDEAASVNIGPLLSQMVQDDAPLSTRNLSFISMTIDGLTIDAATGGISFEPANGQLSFDPTGAAVFQALRTGETASVSLTHQYTDDGNLTATAKTSFQVEGADDAPVAQDDSRIFAVDTTTIITDLVGNDTDGDGDSLHITNVGTAAHGTVVLNANGSISYTPNAGYDGDDQFTYEVFDGTYYGTGTVLLSTANTAPVAVSDDVTLDEDTAYSGNVLANDTDANGDALTATLVDTVQNGSLEFATDGSFTYTPDANFNGSDTFTYFASDGEDVSETTTVNLSVSAIDDLFTVLNTEFHITVEENTEFFLPWTNIFTEVDGDRPSFITTGDFFAQFALLRSDGLTYRAQEYNGVADTGEFNLLIIEGSEFAELKFFVTITDVNDAPVAVDDIVQGVEDTPLEIDVLANDSDPDGGFLSITSVTQPDNGQVVITQNGTLLYTPDSDYNENHSLNEHQFIDYTVTDGTNEVTASVRITVASVHDAPEADEDSYLTFENTPISGDVTLNDSDGDIGITAIGLGPTELVSDVANGTLTLQRSGVDWRGVFTYIPDPGFEGTDTFSYRINGQGTESSNIATVSIFVEGADDKPVVNADNVSVSEDSILTGNVLLNDYDPEEQPLTAALVSGVSNGALNLASDGSYTYTPGADFNGVDSFTYTASDGGLVSDVETVTITVTAANDLPTAADDSLSTGEDQTLAGNVLINDTDPDGDTLKAVLGRDVGHGTLVLRDDGSFDYAPDANFFGTDTFTYFANDGTGNSVTEATVSIDIAPHADAPVAVDDHATFVWRANTPITGNVLDNDTDGDGDTLTAQLVDDVQNGTLELSADGTFTYTPDANLRGIDSFTYLATDGTNQSQLATVTIKTENVAPSVGDDMIVVAPNTSIEIAALANDTDSDGDILSYLSVADPEYGTVSITNTGKLLYRADDNYIGNDSFTYTVTDGLDTSTATVNVTIGETDGTGGNVDIATTLEDQSVAIDVSANDVFEDGDFLYPYYIVVSYLGGQYDVFSVKTSLAGGTIDYDVSDGIGQGFETDGTVVYTPPQDFVGIDSFDYVLREGSKHSVVRVYVNVTPVADATVAHDDQFTVSPGSSVTLAPLTNDIDVDGGPLIVTDFSYNGPAQIQWNTNGTLHYVAADGFTGVDWIDYTVTDGSGESDTATIAVLVDNAPVANDDAGSIDQNRRLIINVLDNDSDVENDDLELVSVSDGDNGTTFINADGTVTYEPDADFVGQDSFTYTITDGDQQTMATVTVDVQANAAPVAIDDTVTIRPGEQIIDVLLNDTDAEGNALSILSVSGAKNGVVTLLSDGTVTYTANLNYQGADSFTYQLDDGGATDVATVFVTVDGGTGPVLQNDAASVDQGQSIDIDVLGNDVDHDGDDLTVTKVQQGAFGTTSINPDGTISYVARDGFTGKDAFTYHVSDGLHTTSATVQVNVEAGEAGPVAPTNLFEGAGLTHTINYFALNVQSDANEITFDVNTQWHPRIVEAFADFVVSGAPASNLTRFKVDLTDLPDGVLSFGTGEAANNIEIEWAVSDDLLETINALAMSSYDQARVLNLDKGSSAQNDGIRNKLVISSDYVHNQIFDWEQIPADTEYFNAITDDPDTSRDDTYYPDSDDGYSTDVDKEGVGVWGIELFSFASGEGNAQVRTHGEDTLSLSFRGTDQWQDYFSDNLRSLSDGGASSYSANRFEPLLTALNSYLEDNPQITNIYVNGHSLGGHLVNSLYFAVAYEGRYEQLKEALFIAQNPVSSPEWTLTEEFAEDRMQNYYAIGPENDFIYKAGLRGDVDINFLTLAFGGYISMSPFQPDRPHHTNNMVYYDQSYTNDLYPILLENSDGSGIDYWESWKYYLSSFDGSYDSEGAHKQMYTIDIAHRRTLSDQETLAQFARQATGDAPLYIIATGDPIRVSEGKATTYGLYQSTIDTNGDGYHDSVDRDGDGIVDIQGFATFFDVPETAPTSFIAAPFLNAIDTDFDGYVDNIDADGDGIGDYLQADGWELSFVDSDDSLLANPIIRDVVSEPDGFGHFIYSHAQVYSALRRIDETTGHVEYVSLYAYSEIPHIAERSHLDEGIHYLGLDDVYAGFSLSNSASKHSNIVDANDDIRAGMYNDILEGLRGDDLLDGGGGDDVILGGAGSDRMIGGAGDDIIIGWGNSGPVANGDKVRTGENTSITIDVLANDTDLDGDNLTISDIRVRVLDNPTSEYGNGTVVVNDDGTLTYTPQSGFQGKDAFVYEITDGQQTAQTLVTVVVDGNPGSDQNIAPVAMWDTATTLVGEGVLIDVLANDYDLDGVSVSFEYGSLPEIFVDGVSETEDIGLLIHEALQFGNLPTDSTDGTPGEWTIDQIVILGGFATAPQHGTASLSGGVYNYGVVTEPSVGSDVTYLLPTMGIGRIFYQPDPDFVGVDTIEYYLWDGQKLDIGKVTITVGNPEPYNQVDTAVYLGERSTFAIMRVSGDAANPVLAIRDLDAADGNEGTDLVRDVDFVEFADMTVDLTTLWNEAVDVLPDYEAPVEDDILDGTDADDLMVGGSGNDIINGHGGNDTIYGGTPISNNPIAYVPNPDGENILSGGAGNDHIIGGQQRDIIYGGDDDDTIDVSPVSNPAFFADDRAYGGAGNDTLNGVDDVNSIWLYGDEGDDLITLGAEGRGHAYGGAGADTIYAGFQSYTYGGAGDDKIYGGSGEDQSYGGEGDDVIEGKDGADTLNGGDGDDFLDGGNGNDTLIGGDGSDTLLGQSGNNILVGGSGRDRMIGLDGADTFTGGEGNDIIQGGTYRDINNPGVEDDLSYGIRDTAIFSGFIDDYSIVAVDGEPLGTAFRVRDLYSPDGDDGTDTVYDIEQLTFADGTFSGIDIATNHAVAILQDAPAVVAPTIALSDVVTSIAEDIDTTTRVKVADIDLNDMGLGKTIISLQQDDGAPFEIDGNAIYIRAGTGYNYEHSDMITAQVKVHDPNIDNGVADVATLNISIADVDEAPVVSITDTSSVARPDAQNGTELAQVLVFDQDDDVFSFAITAGNSDADGDGRNAFNMDSYGRILIGDNDDLVDLIGSPVELTIEVTSTSFTPTISHFVEIEAIA